MFQMEFRWPAARRLQHRGARVVALAARAMFAAALWCAPWYGSAQALVPHEINYQGYLTNPGGTAVSATVAMEFRLYNVVTGGAALFTESQSVTVSNGVFNVLLGAQPGLPLGLPFDVPYWLGVKVGADAEMAPRQPLAAAPYALRAASAEALAAGATVAGSLITGPITSATVTLPAANLTGSIPVAAGGTGQPSLTTNGIVYGQGTSGVGVTAVGTAGQVLAGTGGAPAWSPSLTLNGNLVLANPSTAGTGNIMKGANRFLHNFGGSTFVGENAGNFSLTGGANTGSGINALSSLTNGEWNTAHGFQALLQNQGGSYNTAIGMESLPANISGIANTAVGTRALSNSLASSNIALGAFAGINLTTGGGNIAIGNAGVAAEGNTIRLGDVGHARTFIAGIAGVPAGATGLPVFIDSSGQLGTKSCGAEGDVAVVHNGAWMCKSALPRYVDNGNGTVTDNKTGLMWEKKLSSADATCLSATQAINGVRCQQNTYNWSANHAPWTDPTGTLYSDFLQALNGLNVANGAACFAGYCDWRLPTIAELRTILSAPYPCAPSPCLDTATFGPTQAAFYWSSSSPAGDPDAAWGVDIANGGVGNNFKVDVDMYARAVRTGR